MLPCHGYYIYGTWRRKEVRGLKLWYGGKLKGEKSQRAEQGAIFMGDWGNLTPQLVYLNYLPISVFLGVKRDL